MWPPRASWTARTRRGILLTMDLSLLDLVASQTTITASHSWGLTISRIWIDIWSQICSIRVISGPLADQSMTPMSWFSGKAIMARALRGGALSCTSTKLLWKVPLDQDKGFCLNTRRYTCWFNRSSTMTTSPPKWRAPNIMMDCTTLPSVCCTQASIYAPLHACELESVHHCDIVWSGTSQRRHSASSDKGPNYGVTGHSRRRRRCPYVSLRHLAGMWER